MLIELVAPPDLEPVSLAEARAHLRVTSRDEDRYVELLVSAARHQVEVVTGYALAEQTRRLVVAGFPTGGLPLPRPPLVSVEAVEYVDADGAVQTLDPAEYVVADGGTPGTVLPKTTWPLTAASRPDAVRVTYVCGYDADGKPACPDQLRLAVLALVSHWYDHRTPVEVGTIAAEVPKTFDFLTGAVRFRYHLPEGCS